MTHSLHRCGTQESLSKDYVVLVLRAMGFNDKDYLPKCQEALRIALRHNPVNLGSEMKGNMFEFSPEEIIEQAEGDSMVVFDNPDNLTAFLKDMKEADLGLSVVVSGLFDKVDECFKKAGLNHHTANFSLGIWGKTNLLPSEDILEVTTMCGHGMAPPSLVRAMVWEIRKGRKTLTEVVKLLASNCKCGIFNPTRATELLATLIKKGV